MLFTNKYKFYMNINAKKNNNKYYNSCDQLIAESKLSNI